PAIARVDPRRLRPRRPAVDSRDAPAGPRDVARPARDPRRDALHVGCPDALAVRHGGDDHRVAAGHLDLPAAGLPEGPDQRLPEPGHGSAGCRLPALPVADRGRIRWLDRYRTY